MKEIAALKSRNKMTVFLIVFAVLLFFVTVRADDRIPEKSSNTGKYQALYVGETKSGTHIILIANTETGRIEKRIMYDALNDDQDVFNYVTKEVSTITRKAEKFY